MTDVLGALGLMALEGLPTAPTRRWRSSTSSGATRPLVLDKWLGLQAMSTAPDTLERVVKLTEHEAFSIKNPNKVRALIGTYSRNPVAFHRADGAGYRFVAEQVIALDALNPQVAARMVGAFNRWRRYDAKRAKAAEGPARADCRAGGAFAGCRGDRREGVGGVSPGRQLVGSAWNRSLECFMRRVQRAPAASTRPGGVPRGRFPARSPVPAVRRRTGMDEVGLSER